VGDQRDGINKDALLNIANSLRILNLSRVLHAGSPINYVTQIVGDWPGPFAGDVVIVFPDDNMDGAYLRILGSDQPSPGKSGEKSTAHPH